MHEFAWNLLVFFKSNELKIFKQLGSLFFNFTAKQCVNNTAKFDLLNCVLF